jgi:ribosomal protein L16 Arg81 hydroxylase
MTPMTPVPVTTFEAALAPISLDAFLSEYWNRSWLHVAGHPGKFASVFTWSQLNDVLEHHRLTEQRFQLRQDGKRVTSEQYLVATDGHFVLNAAGLADCLDRGATLVLNGVNEMTAATGAFAESFERVLDSAIKTHINVYAGWRTQNGFDLHWDPHDVTIVQIAGRKRWRVYRPTQPYPVTNSYPEPPRPTGDPVWEGVLEEGDLLYLPRGWWHVAWPVGEASLHLTVGLTTARGVDLIDWMTDQLLQSPETRIDVPLWAGMAEQQVYLSRLRALVTDALGEGALARFRAAREARMVPRPIVCLPVLPTARADTDA